MSKLYSPIFLKLLNLSIRFKNMNRLGLVLAIIIIALSGNAQGYKTIQKAIEAEKALKYEKAIKYLNCALVEDPENAYLHYKMGKNLYNQNKYEDALTHMEQAKSLMKDSMKYQFDMYHLYSVTGLNTFAKEAFVKYVTLCPSCVEGDLLPGKSSNKFMYRKPVKEPELMGLESNKSESYPYIINDNQIQLLNNTPDKSQPTNALHFKQNLTSDFSNHDFLFYDVHQYAQINVKNGKGYGPFTLNKALDKIYTTRWDTKTDRLHIFFSKKREDKADIGWTKYQRLSIEIDNENYNYIHPMLSQDEKHLIFSSNQPGGLGGYDLWIGELTDELTLKNIKNLGTYVNTPGDECFPTVYDNNVMFFASNGHYGFGNLDMYAGVKSRGGRYMKTYNLGNRFNSVNDDYALFYNAKKNTSFFTSNRFKNSSGEMPFDRIYKQSFDKINATISVTDEYNMGITDISVSIPSESINKTTDARGNVTTNVNPLSMKKVVIGGGKYVTIDTVLAPFESMLKVVAKRNVPSDNITFSTVSHPKEIPFPNTYFKLTNLTDNKTYTGTTNESGLGNVTIYADDEYKIEVPEYGFVKDKVKFNGLSIEKFFVKSDMPAESKTSTTNTNATASNTTINLADNFNLYYSSGQWEITEDVNKQIQYVVSILAQNPTYKLELSSHTDCQGDEATNAALSRQRVAEARKLFFMRGVAEEQMIGKYYGEVRPINSCSCDQYGNYNCSPEEMRKNRRTEVKVLVK
jgi:outer membrane protein OmpA-like peptidoglycan-associated protein/tetratricopeptide (TPR) repeat protein